MEIRDAQRDVRTTFLGGFFGQLVSGALWATSAALATWSSPFQGMVCLVAGGVLIFPLTMLVLRLSGRRASLADGNPMGELARQIAFTIPATIPVVLAATVARLSWFYPAILIIVGAHYLPFAFLYGMPAFQVLGALMISAGFLIGWFHVGSFALGGWVGAAMLIVFAFVGRMIASRDTA